MDACEGQNNSYDLKFEKLTEKVLMAKAKAETIASEQNSLMQRQNDMRAEAVEMI